MSPDSLPLCRFSTGERWEEREVCAGQVAFPRKMERPTDQRSGHGESTLERTFGLSSLRRLRGSSKSVPTVRDGVTYLKIIDTSIGNKSPVSQFSNLSGQYT